MRRQPVQDPQEVTKRHIDGSAVLIELISANFDGKWVSSNSPERPASHGRSFAHFASMI